MPLAAVQNLGSNENSGSLTIAVSPSRAVEVGEFIVITFAQRDHTITSFADNSSQAGTANTYTENTSRETADPFCHIYSCQVTRKILASDTITITCNGSGGGKSMCILALTDANDASQFDVQANAFVFNPGTAYASGTTGATAQADEYAIGVCTFANSIVDAGTITADSPWALQFSTVPAGGGSAHGSRVLTATGTYSFTGDWGADPDGDQSGCIATYRGTSSASSALDGIDVSKFPKPKLRTVA
jgi:hypothetical protein